MFSRKATSEKGGGGGFAAISGVVTPDILLGINKSLSCNPIFTALLHRSAQDGGVVMLRQQQLLL